MRNKIVLIDGNSILNRAFYGIPLLTNSEGIHTNAIYGFLNILFKILQEETANYLTVAFDLKEPTFRHKMFTEYKSNRKGMPQELLEQVPIIKDVLIKMNFKIIEKAGYEADDLLGTLTKRAINMGYDVSVISGDRDLLQLASDKVKVRIPKTTKLGTSVEDYNTKEVIEKYSITPEQIIDLKGLAGDKSDNIPGVPSIGEKTAVKILQNFKTIENAYEHIEEVTPNRAKEALSKNYDLAILSKQLATIKLDCDIDFNFEDAKIHDIYNKEVFKILKRLEFKTFFKYFKDTDIENNVEDIEKSFKIINSFSQCEEIFNNIEKLCKNLAFKLIFEENKLYGISLSYDKETYFIVIEGFITQSYIIDKLNRLINLNMILITNNLKEQLYFINANEESNIIDLGVAAYLLNPIKDSYNYDDIAKDYMNLAILSRSEFIEKLKFNDAILQKEKEFFNMSCYESFVLYKSYDIIMKKLEETQMKDLFFNIEMPLIYTLYDMEVRGIKANENELKQFSKELSIKIEKIETDIYKLAGEKFKINSPKQLGVILFEKLKLPCAKKTKTGYSTSADILEKLKSENPIVDMILKYRQLTKLKSTYAEGLVNYINKEDNRIHGKFNQTTTATGRISSTEPNLQNIPIREELGKQIRKVFVPENEYVFVDADYSQIELRVLAHMSQDEMLIKAYNSEQDIHKITASQVFHTPLNEVTSKQRSNAKAVNFGIIYGISSFALGQDLDITNSEAQEYIEKYFTTYPKVKQFLNNMVEKASQDGYVTTMFGRRRIIPEISSSNYTIRSFGERIAMNSPIQGTSADIIKIAMVNVNKKLKKLKFKSRLLLQIHDELLVEAHNDEVEKVKEILKEEMYNAAKLEVPLEIDVNIGTNWYEVK